MTRSRVATTGWMVALLWAVAAHANLLEAARQPDPAYRWQIQSSSPRAIVADLISQHWRETAWRHSLRIARPTVIRHPELAILIVGGDGRREFVDETALAEAAGVPVATVGNVPNQPLYGHREDGLISFTFEQFLRTGDPDWPLLLPMTRATVRAMDAFGEIAAKQWRLPIRRFVVTGASKRGWTTWLAGAADPRVAGIVPVVFDNLAIAAQLKNQFAVWNAYSPMIGDYTERQLPKFVETERGRELLAEVDPHAHLARLVRVPKLVVNGSNDPYWELAALGLYWSDLRGEKTLLEVPNAGHDAGGDPRVPPTIAAFVERLATAKPMPELRWAGGERDASLVSNEEPTGVGIWVAQSPSRDFRKAGWKPIVAKREGDRWIADASLPTEGFVAIFGEAHYTGPAGPFAVSTPVRILAPAS